MLVNDILQMSMSENRYYEAVNSLADLQITRGFKDGSFKPDLNITRAEFSVFLSKTLAVRVKNSRKHIVELSKVIS